MIRGHEKVTVGPHGSCCLDEFGEIILHKAEGKNNHASTNIERKFTIGRSDSLFVKLFSMHLNKVIWSTANPFQMSITSVSWISNHVKMLQECYVTRPVCYLHLKISTSWLAKEASSSDSKAVCLDSIWLMVHSDQRP